jgi:hypothetical protein
LQQGISTNQLLVFRNLAVRGVVGMNGLECSSLRFEFADFENMACKLKPSTDWCIQLQTFARWSGYYTLSSFIQRSDCAQGAITENLNAFYNKALAIFEICTQCTGGIRYKNLLRDRRTENYHCIVCICLRSSLRSGK